jgi:hypothetical protein
MDNSFFAYIQRLELIAFFSGYPLIYTVIIFLGGSPRLKNNIGARAIALLPCTYALVGALFIGLQLKKLYPDYSFEHIKLFIGQSWLIIWGLLPVLFWIPVIRKKSALSLIHSLVFFFLVIWDLLLQLTGPSADKNILTNDVNVYVNSVLLNLGAFGFTILMAFLFTRYIKRSAPHGTARQPFSGSK